MFSTKKKKKKKKSNESFVSIMSVQANVIILQIIRLPLFAAA